MAGRRSGRLPTLPWRTASLDEIAPAHHAITRAQAVLAISRLTYAKLNAAGEMLDRGAVVLGHPRG